MFVYMYIYIYIEREREREIDMYKQYIYIYVIRDARLARRAAGRRVPAHLIDLSIYD